MNFFDTQSYRDPQSLGAYLASRSMDQIHSDVATSQCDPNEVLCAGDAAFFVLQNKEGAQILYQYALQLLDAQPDLLAPDINLLFARRNLCAIYVEKNSFNDVLKMLSATPEIMRLDPSLAVTFAWRLYESEKFKVATEVLERVLALPQAELADKVNIPLENLRALYADARAKSGGKRMQDLQWFWDEANDPVPEGILTMSFDALRMKGLRAELTGRVRSAVIMNVSNDRKMWYVFFYDQDDPTTLMQREGSQLFFVSYYHRDGNVQVSDVAC